MSFDISKIYSAVYSGVPVYEMMCRGIAVMRRRCDSYLNATQILKVAGIEKGKRTKILEREVLHGTHEKVQGGYGKYQGTWVPFERGVELAEQYEVEECLHPLLYYNPTANGSKDKTPTKEQAREQAIAAQKSQTASINSHKRKQSPPVPPLSPVLKRTKSENLKSTMNPNLMGEKSPFPSNNRTSEPPRKKNKPNGSPTILPISNNGHSQTIPSRRISNAAKEIPNPSDPYRTALMGIFMSDQPTELPEILNRPDPPAEFSFDLSIDEQGHSAVHWAAALGHVEVLEQLISKGANSLRLNTNQESPLIRAVLVTNNYDRRTFPKMLEVLQENLPLTDHKQRSVFHHIAAMGNTKSRLLSANYYMETVLNWLSEHPNVYPNILDIQDKKGDTALNIAARQNTRSLIKLLLEAGANPEISNKNGAKPNDIELVKEITKTSDTLNLQDKIESVASDLHGLPDLSSFQMNSDSEDGEESGPSKQCLEFVQAVQNMATELDSVYATELRAKKRQLREMNQHIKVISKELSENRRVASESQSQANRLIEAQMKVSQLERTLKQKDEQLRKYITAAPNVQAHISLHSVTHGSPETEARIEGSPPLSPIEGKYKKLIAACCDVPVGKVDELLDPLLHTLEDSDSNSKIDIDRLTRFMIAIRDRERIPPTESNNESLVLASTVTDSNIITNASSLMVTVAQKANNQTNTLSMHEWSSCASSVDDSTTSRSTPSMTSTNDIS
ncbi:transcriptional regulator swi6 [Basidiobolus ranarum]|uniref:Transcriptional regulator swi6 n=1 Tax=Basidiobolus ranarum TaxID=34480 RepID=A0ABR2X383_9FUNG